MQETRGTPLNDPRPRPKGIALFVATAVVVVVVDQLTKWWAVSSLRGHEPIRVLGGLLGLEFLRNPGAALGTAAGYTVVLSLIAVAVIVILVSQVRRLRDRWWALGLGLFLGGAVGNLLDRVFREPAFLRGHVVDFINYANFFVGNVADLALTVAAVVILVRSAQGVRLDGTVVKRTTDG